MGKYRDLLLAILLFIVLDLGILFFNVFASIQLERDARRINAAGELRMLTQQIAKALLTLQVERQAGLPIQTSMAQLQQGQGSFNRSLQDLSASLQGEFEFTLFGIDAAALREAVGRVEREWRPLDASIEPLLRQAEPELLDVEIAVNKAVARNIRLAGLSDDVTQAVEAAANRKTLRMRQIQLTAIVLALLNFVYIVFKFLRRLHASDRLAEAARREVDDILSTVSEGLLLVHADGRVGTQFSRSVHALLGQTVQAGQDFRALLRRALGPQRAEEAADYLKLLFDPKVKPALLEQLNPLRLVAVQSAGGEGAQSRHLSFAVRQVREGGQVRELLVTMFDVSEKVRLEQELAASQQAARGDVEDLLQMLESDPARLQAFLQDARQRLDDFNQTLREAGRGPISMRERLAEAARMLHGLKGEAALFGLGALARQIHQMENVLTPLAQRSDPQGPELIALALELAQVVGQVDRLQRTLQRLQRLGCAAATGGAVAAAKGEDAADLLQQLARLTETVARDLGKQARFVVQGELPPLPAALLQTLQTVLPQLIRNAVAHGIEPPPERQRLGKSAAGEVRLALAQEADGTLVLTLSDDGRGIPLQRLRERAAAQGRRLDALGEQDLLNLIFEPEVSTAEQVGEHAGRGLGLALVRDKLAALGARLRVSTAPGQYTRFTLQFRGIQ